MADIFPATALKFQCYFYVGSTLTDPTAITLKVQDPAGVVTTYSGTPSVHGDLTHTATGDFCVDVTVATEGTWKWRWAATGAVTAADEGEVEVTRSEFV